MKIEDAINQKKPFTTPMSKVIVNVLYTAGWCKEISERYFKEYDLTNKQYNILRILRGASGPISTSQIRERMLEKMSDVSRLVDRLAKKELVLKTKNNLDHRLVDVTLTDKGLDLINNVASPGEVDNIFEETLLPNELELLSDLLDRFRC